MISYRYVHSYGGAAGGGILINSSDEHESAVVLSRLCRNHPGERIQVTQPNRITLDRFCLQETNLLYYYCRTMNVLA